MNMNKNILKILEQAQEGGVPSKADCKAMLDCSETSAEASVMRAVADNLMRNRFGNESIVLGQIGIEIDKCTGQCKFCSFGELHTDFEPSTMSIDEVIEAAKLFTQSGDLYALFLMTMHDFEFERLIEIVERIREAIPEHPELVVNIGDFSRQQAEQLRDAGVNGAYHVCRLREGIDTALDPEQRKETIRTIKDAGLDWYYCCEPIGPEHTSEELVDQLFLGVEYGCFQHATMRRVYMPHSPLAAHGQISELRLGQITAVVALASLGCADTKNIAVHEPNLIGLTSGANVVYAESGANPRDTKAETSQYRGRDIHTCKSLLYEAGFENLLTATDGHRSLSKTYMI